MRMLRFGRRFAGALGVALLVFIGVDIGACGPTEACIEWNPGEGSCPAQDDALQYFGGDCSDVKSVDSKGTPTDGDLCCYNVTKYDSPPSITRKEEAACGINTGTQ